MTDNTPNQPDPLQELWRDEENDAMTTVDISALESAVETFETRIRRRNLRETLVGVGMILVFGVTAFLAAPLLIKLGSGLLVLGIGWILYTLFRRGSPPPDPNGLETAEFAARHRAHLLRQAALLERVPVWYIGAMLPGWGLMYAYMVQRALANGGGAWTLTYGVGAALLTGGVIWMNRKAAMALREEAEAIEVR